MTLQNFCSFVVAALISAVVCSSSSAQSTPPTVPTGEKAAQSDATQLPSPPNPELQKLLGEAQDLQGRHRYFDALAKLDEAERIAPKDANVFNIRGAIYLVPAVREFDKAEEQFKKALSIEAGALAPQFNLAELLFVKHSFPEAEAAFLKLLNDFPKIQMQVRHLIVFKALAAQTLQSKIKEAEATQKTYFTFMDDTPAYYFAKACLAFANKKEDEAKEWMEKANTIFKPQENAPYLDSLMEARLIPNIMLPPSAAK
jgi:tetratricopeptide (TPR) repeat protein